MIITIDRSRSNGVLDTLGAASARSGASMRIIDWNDGLLSVNVIGHLELDALGHPAIMAVHRGRRNPTAWPARSIAKSRWSWLAMSKSAMVSR